MKALFHRSLMLLAGVCGITVTMVLAPAWVLAASNPSTPAASKRWAQFALDQRNSSGDLQSSKPVNLTIALGGVPQGMAPIVAICESVLFESRTVTLELDGDSMTLKATVTLDPMPKSRTSVHPKAARIQVTFARLRQDRFERFMKRIVYVTMDRPESLGDSAEPPLIRPDEAGGPSVELAPEESQPDVPPVTAGEVAEEDLLPFADQPQGKAYWTQVSHLISRSWARQVRGIRKGPSSETVRVHFRLFPSGRAQLIEIEKGSGAREIDEAGIYTVVNAQPFPPFPAELGDESVDVHVRMRTGARPRPRNVQSVTSQSDGKPDAPPPAPKK